MQASEKEPSTSLKKPAISPTVKNFKAKGFDQALVDDIIKAHEEHHKDDQQ